jgi:hypothetical protein
VDAGTTAANDLVQSLPKGFSEASVSSEKSGKGLLFEAGPYLTTTSIQLTMQQNLFPGSVALKENSGILVSHAEREFICNDIAAARTAMAIGGLDGVNAAVRSRYPDDPIVLLLLDSYLECAVELAELRKRLERPNGRPWLGTGNAKQQRERRPW